MTARLNEMKRALASLDDDERADVFSGSSPITFQASGIVNVYCDSGRDYHVKRNKEKFHLGRFIRIFERDLKHETPEGASTALHQHVHPGRKVWRSVAIPRSRTYVRHGEDGTHLEQWREEILSSSHWLNIAEGSGKDVYEYQREVFQLNEDGDTDPREVAFPVVTSGNQANVLPHRWAHDAGLPTMGYQFAQHIVQDDGSIWFRMECPCGYRIRDIAETEISPIFDKIKVAQRQVLTQRTDLLAAGKDDESEELELKAQEFDRISVQGLFTLLN